MTTSLRTALLTPELSKTDRWIWRAILLFNMAMIFSTALVQTIGVALLILGTVKLLKGEYSGKPFATVEIAFLCFIAARMISVIFSVESVTSIRVLHAEIPFYFLFFFFVRELPIRDKNRITWILLIMFMCASIAALFGSLNYLLGFDHRASSTTSGYYTLGMYLVAVLALLLSFGRSKEVIKSRVVWMVAVVVISVGIILTFNRIHWGILVLVVGIIGLLQERALLAWFVGAAGGALLLHPSIYERFERLLTFPAHMEGRDIIWGGAVDLITKSPIVGFGPKTFHTIFPYFDRLLNKDVGTWHNDFLQIYMESGLLALIPYVVFLILVFILAFQTWKKLRRVVLYGPLSIGLPLSLMTFLIAGLVGVFITDPIISLLFLELLAMVVAISKMNSIVGNLTAESKGPTS